MLRYCSICWQKTLKFSHCNYCNKWDYGKCYECGEQNIKPEWCPNCKQLEITLKILPLTNGFNKIDQLIHESQLKQNHNCWRWIDHTELDNIQYLSEGGYGIVYKAVWNNMPEEIEKNYLNASNASKIVAMKKLKNSQNITKDFINEIKAYNENNYSYIIPIYCITRDPITNEYAIVMQYCDKGDWKHIIRQNDKSLSWRDRLHMLFNMTNALKEIHENGYVHCDIHPGNILQNEYSSYLSDLGLCNIK
ncbi:hypothetical protein Glove_61g17 [Diversispora epigaea]|uniref:Protein kinase domain-containing protein n=1 Tax=Diversispora epigaea TaxID=1348612 RepID=A0A397JDT6_9GLOM|nr:hypothetical protein Glove_61g17 [Diversispora epigaea]